VVAEAAWFAFDDFIPMRVSSTVNGSGYPRRVNSVYMVINRSVSVLQCACELCCEWVGVSSSGKFFLYLSVNYICVNVTYMNVIDVNDTYVNGSGYLRQVDSVELYSCV